MSIALDIFCYVVLLTILFDTILSVVNGVGGFGWLISTRDVIMDVAFWQFSKNPPNSTSMADATKFLIMLHYTCTGTFSRGIACIGVLDLVHNKKYPPALLRASDYDM